MPPGDTLTEPLISSDLARAKLETPLSKIGQVFPDPVAHLYPGRPKTQPQGDVDQQRDSALPFISIPMCSQVSEDKRIISSSPECVGGVTKCNLRNWKYQVRKENPLGKPRATCMVGLGKWNSCNPISFPFLNHCPVLNSSTQLSP